MVNSTVRRKSSWAGSDRLGELGDIGRWRVATPAE
jgi:hypothetical protein